MLATHNFDIMYGLLLEGIYYYLRTVFGEEMLQEIRVKGNVTHVNFSTHKVTTIWQHVFWNWNAASELYSTLMYWWTNMVVTASNWFSKHMFKAVENLKNMLIKIQAYAMLCLMPIIWNACSILPDVIAWSVDRAELICNIVCCETSFCHYFLIRFIVKQWSQD